MDNQQFKLEGVEELLGKFAAIKSDVKYKGGRFALRKAANIVANAVKQGAKSVDDPATGRSITDNIAVRFSNRTFKRNGNLLFRVGIMQGAVLSKGGNKSAKSPTPHWRLLEFGSEKTRATPFIRPALENNISSATAEFITQYKKAIDRAIKKASKAAV